MRGDAKVIWCRRCHEIVGVAPDDASAAELKAAHERRAHEHAQTQWTKGEVLPS